MKDLDVNCISIHLAGFLATGWNAKLSEVFSFIRSGAVKNSGSFVAESDPSLMVSN